MECPSCRAMLPQGGRFCMECGSPLPRLCPACGKAIAVVAKFCPECGLSLATGDTRAEGDQAKAPLEQPTPHPAPTAERRRLTVMLCDLVGSTAVAVRVDPEELREVIVAYHGVVGETVKMFDGYIAKYMGDGVLVYFGFPHAHEDDPERAIRAGLAMVENLRQVTTNEPLHVRVGIATGLVVVGDIIGTGAAQEQTVVGDTPHLAARLQAIAEPDTVIISQETRRLVGDLFELVDLGSFQIKGFCDLVHAWRVVGESAAESRFEAMHRGDLTPLVGRDNEIALLLERWEAAKGGEGQVVLIASEAGVGKSRIIRELRQRISDVYMPISHYGSPYHTSSTLHPVVSLLERALGFERADTPDLKLKKLESLLALGSGNPGEAVSLIAPLLALPQDSQYPALDLPPRQRKQRSLEVLVEQLEGLSRRQPVLAIYEDAHWMDPTTIELIDMIVQRVSTLPALVIVSYRPEFAPRWAGYPHVLTLSLSKLTRRHGLAIVSEVTHGKPLPREVLDQILRKTDGIPLFVEELTKSVLESGLLLDAGDHFELSGPLQPLAIPATLHDSLLARLDRLGRVKEVAQVGAVLGATFSYQLLAMVCFQSEPELRACLEELVRSEMVFRRGTPPEAMYSFKHALVQDAAYESLLKSRRQQLHARIAAVLEKHFPETIAIEPEILARHLSLAGLHESAVRYWRKAGEIAVRRSANVEAIAHFSNALESLATQPTSRTRSEQELALQTALAVPFIATKGTSGVEVERTYRRALALCEMLGKSDELFPISRGLWNCYLARGHMQQAHDHAVHLSARAEEHGSPLQRALAHRAVGSSLFFLGRFCECLHETDQAIAIDDALDESDIRSQLSLYGERPGIISRLYGGWALWFLGFPDRSVAHFDVALRLAQDFGHAHGLAFALCFAASMRNNRRDFVMALEHAESASEIATKHDLPLWLGESFVSSGYAMASLGRHLEGITRIRSGITVLDQVGDWHHRSQWLCLLAAAYLEAGAEQDALATLDEAQKAVAATDEIYFAPELERLRGALLKQQGQPEEAETCFRKAIHRATGMGAKSLELRAAISLARVWGDKGKRAAAYGLLAPVYGWFAEGLDSNDLVDAKVLLEELK
jgi:class 3 adenylate cyclase/tetratricopeptide (TPR) repeat protein